MYGYNRALRLFGKSIADDLKDIYNCIKRDLDQTIAAQRSIGEWSSSETILHINNDLIKLTDMYDNFWKNEISTRSIPLYNYTKASELFGEDIAKIYNQRLDEMRVVYRDCLENMCNIEESCTDRDAETEKQWNELDNIRKMIEYSIDTFWEEVMIS